MNAENTDYGKLGVLVIDDDKPIRSLIKMTLMRTGVNDIELASNGQEALNQVNSANRLAAPFDVIVCDWDMPVMNGITFIEKYREISQKSTLIMLTARTDTSDFSQAKRLGVDYFFMKPLEGDMLRIRLKGAMDSALDKK